MLVPDSEADREAKVQLHRQQTADAASQAIDASSVAPWRLARGRDATIVEEVHVRASDGDFASISPCVSHSVFGARLGGAPVAPRLSRCLHCNPILCFVS